MASIADCNTTSDSLGDDSGPHVSLHPSYWDPCTGRQHHSGTLQPASLSQVAPKLDSARCPDSEEVPPEEEWGESARAAQILSDLHSHFQVWGLTFPACGPSTTITR